MTVDAVLIGLALVAGGAAWLGWLESNPRHLGLAHEHSIANVWNYLKWALIAALFSHLWWSNPVPLYGAAAVVFGAVFLDDAFELHEKANALVSLFAGNLAPQRAGAVVLGILSLGAAGVMAKAWSHSPQEARNRLKPLLKVTVFLIFVGGGLDLAESEARNMFLGSAGKMLGFALGILEDGTELIIGSAILGMVLGIRADLGTAALRAGGARQ